MVSFPFGSPLLPLEQQDRTPKKLFVLGVYASAVHARWLGPDGRELVKALAIASEPEIFWTGEDAAAIIKLISIPLGAGRLEEPKPPTLNGPSGRSLDQDYLHPLGITRQQAWLCDLLPESRLNAAQRAKLEQHYVPRMKQWALPPYTIEPVEKARKQLTNAARREQIAAQVVQSQCQLLVTLGDEPLRWFTRFFGSRRKLREYVTEPHHYGDHHKLTVAGHQLELLPLVHPRQAAGLGRSSLGWGRIHRDWKARLGLDRVSER